MTKKNNVGKIILIIVLILLVIGIIWIMVNALNGNINLSKIRFSSSVSDELVLDETYDNVFNAIDINVQAGDIYVKGSDDQSIRVVIYGDEKNTKVKTKEDELDIDIDSDVCIGFCFNESAKIEVYLPSDYSNLINISNQYGNIEVDSFKEATMEIEEEAGDVSVKAAKKLKIDNEFGNIEIDEVIQADVHDAAGNIIIKSVHDAKVENEYGNIEIANVYNSLDINNECGNIVIDNMEIKKNSTIKDSLGDIKIGSTNEIYIDAKTDLGDVDINNNYRDSEITLKITNAYGDVTVNN